MIIIELNQKKSFGRFILIGSYLLIVNLTSAYLAINLYRNNFGFEPTQSVQFSHKAHIEKYDMKCVSCHYFSIKSPSSGIPTTWDCMICHSALKNETELMKPVNYSYDENIPLSWKRVFRVPDYVHFSHEAHTRAMIDCSSCHGNVEKLDKVILQKKITMKWCLDCHREPLKYIVPARRISGIFTGEYSNFSKVQYKMNNSKIKESEYGYYLPGAGKVDCSICHY